jgi:hypothetical protein
VKPPFWTQPGDTIEIVLERLPGDGLCELNDFGRSIDDVLAESAADTMRRDRKTASSAPNSFDAGLQPALALHWQVYMQSIAASHGCGWIMVQHGAAVKMEATDLLDTAEKSERTRSGSFSSYFCLGLPPVLPISIND